ncbi:MAG: DNA internalization-related competence protein ComEC/Rec2 [Deltaproteobacteria bacterium]|nr:DNA internalization-related competence protein ComEC/Rec2 [Deltaproteobacteria bacterium]
MSRPFLFLVTAIATGITCGSHCRIPDLPILVALIALLAAIPWFWRFPNRRVVHLLFLTSLFLLGILDINLYLHPYIAADHIMHFTGSGKISVEGIISENPKVSPEKTELVVSVCRIIHGAEYRSVSGRILLTIREPYPFRYGDFVRFQARLRVPRNFQNPDGFDYEEYLRLRGIVLRGSIKDSSGFVVLRTGRGNPLRQRLEDFRDLIRTAILARSPGTEGAIIQAMILGDQKMIPKEVMEKFNRTGTSHIIAISGFNIGIIAMFALFLVRLCLKGEFLLLHWNIAKISIYIALVVVVLYTFIAGAGISVIRASIMVAVFLSALLMNREGDLYNTLCLAAFLILIVAPFSLFDISFQLSFSAVAALVFFMPKWLALIPASRAGSGVRPTRESGLRIVHKAFRGTVVFFLASLSATLGTLPLILFYFNRLSLISLAANLICVPILGVAAIPVCLVIILAVPLSPTLADGVVRLSEILVRISIYLIDGLATLPWAAVYVPTPSLPEIGAFYLLLIWAGLLLGWLIQRKSSETDLKMPIPLKVLPVILTFFLAADGANIYFRSVRTGRLSLTAIDVGQGSSILVRLPGRQNMLVDGGGIFDDTFDLGRYVLAPYLWHEGISRIETVVLTHPHPDHLQGLLFVLENFRVREVWTNDNHSSESELYWAFRRIVREKGIILRPLSSHTPPVNISGVQIHFLNPDGNLARTRMGYSPQVDVSPPHPSSSFQSSASLAYDEVNARSLAMKLSYGNARFILPSDMTQGVESLLVRAGVDLQGEVIFVPHHGSNRSSSAPFVEKVKPRIAVISCGAENIFGFPHPDVLRRYEAVQAQVYRTDRSGAVTVTTDGQKIAVDLFMPATR